LRFFTYLIPGYNETYRNADKILVGSSYTLDMLKKMFSFDDQRLELFYENGILPSFFNKPNDRKFDKEIVELLFLGRLVPYKGADILIEALSHLPENVRQKTRLKIVGNGPEKKNLEELAQTLQVGSLVDFVGWVKNEETVSYYKNADIFCFPSLREFGGAVVLEAMASGLPCIVVDHGGISEYVTNETGIKIIPESKEYVIAKLTDAIEKLIEDPKKRKELSENSIQRAGEFEWGKKADRIVTIYEELIKIHPHFQDKYQLK
jgi:glycosyltransferase involved in cell wall biosynthesis